MKAALHLLVGGIVAAALMAAAIVLWTRALIVFAAPLGVASLAAVWVAIDNQFVYRRQDRPNEGPDHT